MQQKNSHPKVTTKGQGFIGNYDRLPRHLSLSGKYTNVRKHITTNRIAPRIVAAINKQNAMAIISINIKPNVSSSPIINSTL